MIAGRYTIEREIGRGGMGAVWLGVDETLGRQVALKRIGMLPGAGSTDLARAEREARLAARLNHPHVVSVFNLVVDDDAQWLVMEYVAGVTLAQLVREQGTLSPDEAAPLLWQAADALVAAHEAGIVHRDVKPSNILVDSDRRVKLTDFGIARGGADPSLTMTGLVTGSPAYLAPEVALGGRGDEAVDVWSLGATAFHVLAGRPPYESSDNVLGALYRIVNDEPPRLADAGWMAPMLEGTMAKDPSRRWSMAQVRDFLATRAERADRAERAGWAEADDATAVGLPLTIPQPAARSGSASESVTGSATATQVLGAPVPDGTVPGSPQTRVASTGATWPTWPTGATGVDWRRPSTGVALVVLGACLLLVLVPYLLLRDADPAPAAGAAGPDSPAARPTTGTARPTAEGMEAFIRDYVAAVGSDPDAAWQMLTPKFQRESGGLANYRDFWDGVGAGQILTVSADPESLVVSYRVRFENFGTGRRPTVLDLVYDGDRYLIHGERTTG